jgi:hypothetical protein
MLSILLTSIARAQDESSLNSAADLHREPEGAPLVSLTPGAPVETGKARGDWREVTVEGWIFSPSTAPSTRDGFDLVVTPGDGENLRRSPNGPVVGRAREGTLLEKVGAKGQWTRVRRNGWVPRTSVRAGSPAGKSVTAARPPASPRQEPQTPVPAPPAARGTGPRSGADAERAQTARATVLNATPDGGQYGSLSGGAPARIVGRSGEWAKVQVEGWVKEADLQATDDSVLRGVTAEEVRASPNRFLGQTVEWKLQLIAVQNADALRAEIPPGQPYLLTRGPLPEPGFVYVMIPTEKAAEFRALPALQELTLRLTIRAPHTRYLSTPVAELVAVVR